MFYSSKITFNLFISSSEIAVDFVVIDHALLILLANVLDFKLSNTTMLNINGLQLAIPPAGSDGPRWHDWSVSGRLGEVLLKSTLFFLGMLSLRVSP